MTPRAKLTAEQKRKNRKESCRKATLKYRHRKVDRILYLEEMVASLKKCCNFTWSQCQQIRDSHFGTFKSEDEYVTAKPTLQIASEMENNEPTSNASLPSTSSTSSASNFTQHEMIQEMAPQIVYAHSTATNFSDLATIAPIQCPYSVKRDPFPIYDIVEIHSLPPPPTRTPIKLPSFCTS